MDRGSLKQPPASWQVAALAREPHGRPERGLGTGDDWQSVPFLQRMLRDEVPDGWTELSCHPGYRSPGYSAVYLAEREEEVRTLTDSRVRATVEEQGIRLRSFDEVPAVAPAR